MYDQPQTDRITDILRSQASQPVDKRSALLQSIAQTGGGANYGANIRQQQGDINEAFEKQIQMGDRNAKALSDRIAMFTGGDPEGTSMFLQALHDDPETIDPNNAYQVMTKLAGIAKQTGYVSPELAYNKEKQSLDLQKTRAEIGRLNRSGTGLAGEAGYSSGSPSDVDENGNPTGGAGVPIVQPDTRGLSGKDASMYNKQTRLAAQKRLQDPTMTEAASKAGGNINDAARFEELMDTQETGGWRNFVPDRALSLDSEMSEMKSIQDRLAPQQRVPGSGASSDNDVEMFKNALPSFNKPKATNINIIAARKAAERDVLEYQNFLADYLDVNGHLNKADAAWKEYIEANPIFDPKNATKKNVVLNPNRVDYRTYFNGGGSPASGGFDDAKKSRLQELRAKRDAGTLK